MAFTIRKNQKKLDLSGNHLSDHDFSDLMDALSSPACRIEELQLDRNGLEDTFCTQLASIINNNPSLKKLVLSDNRLYGPHFIDLMDALSGPDCRIEELYLDRNDLPDTSCLQLAFGIRENQFLKKLVLSSNQLYGPHFIDLMDALSSPACRIEELHLDRNDLPDTSCAQLALGIGDNQSLKRLDLSNNHLSGPHLIDLMDALSGPACRIEELHLAENDLQDTSCAQLALGISDNQSLKILDLSYNNLSGPHFIDLMDALSSPDCKIEELHLVENHLSDMSCAQLALGISDNESLKKLNLSNNRLSGPHFEDFLDALSSPACRIEELRLDRNDLRDTSCTQLALGISGNKSLKKLDLSNNNLSGSYFSDLIDTLYSPDCRIEELRLEYNELSEEEKEAVKELEKDKPNLKIVY